MPLDKQTVGISFNQGLDTRTDERLVVPGKLLLLNNLTLSGTGTMARRDGVRALTNSGLTSVNGCGLFNDELLAINRESLYSYSTAKTTSYNKGKLSPLTLAKEGVRHVVGYITEVDCATSGSLTCYVWRDYAADQTTINGIYAMVKDETTGTVVYPATQLSSSTTALCPRVGYVAVVAGATDAACFIFAWADGTAIKGQALRISTLALAGAVVDLATDQNSGTSLDAIADQGNLLVAYGSSDATYSTRVIQVIYAGGAVIAARTGDALTQANVPVGTIAGLAIAGFTTVGKIGCYTYAVTGGAYAGVWATTFTTTATTITALGDLSPNKDATGPAAGNSRITATPSGAAMAVFYDNASSFNAGGQVPIRWLTIDTNNSVTVAAAALMSSNTYSATASVCGPFIAAKALTNNGSPYLPVHVGSVLAGGTNLQNSWFLLDSAAAVAAKALYGTYGLWSINNNVPTSRTPPSTPTVGTSVCVPVGERTTLSFASGTNISPVGLSRLLLTFFATSGAGNQSAQLGQNTFFAGGFLAAYDGSTCVEAGFHLFPEGVSVATGAAGSIGAGAYQYVAMYEWFDAAGQRHQSAPSPAVSYTAPGAARATVTIPTLLLTSKTGVNVVVARTVASGTVFYRLNAQNAPVANTAAAATVTYSDNTTDANLVSGEIVYTTGGILPNNGPPACSTLTVHQNRLFLGGLEDPNEFRYSQPQVVNFGLQFNETLAGRVDPNAGRLVTMAPLDDKLVLFSQRKPFVMVGSGPATTGAQNGYSTPVELASDLGCREKESVLKMPMGILFKGTKGFHLLNRGLQVQYIGGAVYDYDSRTITAAVLLDSKKECRFYTDDITVLVYSYLVDQWSTYEIASGATGAVWWADQSKVVSADISGGSALYADTAGLYVDTDGVSAITTIIDTGWLRPDETVHRFQRVYRLLLEGTYVSSGSLTIQAYYDYDTTVVSTLTVAATSALKSTANNQWELRWRLPRQKCQAVRFKITEAPSGGTLAGLGYTAMSLELGVKKGVAKLPAAQSM